MTEPLSQPMPESIDKYAQMLQLADGFDATGEQLRVWARLGAEILRDDDVTQSAELSPKTWKLAEEDVRAASTGKHGLLNRGIELDADALVVRATVLTYQWIDDLQTAAFKNLGSVAARAIGYLAPEVELGGSLVSAGLIETDALDREGVTAYLGELAVEHPELMDHIAGGGGLVESLQLRALLTARVPQGEDLTAVAAGGLRATGLDEFDVDTRHAVRDVAGELVALESAPHPSPGSSGSSGSAPGESTPADGSAPHGIYDLMRTLADMRTSVDVRPAANGRYIAYLAGPGHGRPQLRLVSGDVSSYAAEADAAIAAAVPEGARVMLVGASVGGETAAKLAAGAGGSYTVEQVVTAGAPGAAAPRIPESTRVLSLEDRSDPVALLGGLINQSATHRLTVVYDGSTTDAETAYAAGGRAADSATHPELVAEIGRIRELGYLA